MYDVPFVTSMKLNLLYWCFETQATPWMASAAWNCQETLKTWSKKFSTALLPWQFVGLFPPKTSFVMFSYDMLHHCLQVSMSKLIVFFHPVPCLLEDYRRIGNMNDEHFEMTKMDSSDFRSISTFWSSLFLITVPLGPCFFPLGSCNCSPSHWSTDLPRLFKKGCFQNEKVKKDKEKTKVTVFKAVSLFFAPWCVKCRCLDVLHARMPLESVLHMVRPRPRLLGEAPLQRETGKRQTKCVCFC